MPMMRSHVRPRPKTKIGIGQHEQIVRETESEKTLCVSRRIFSAEVGSKFFHTSDPHFFELGARRNWRIHKELGLNDWL